MNYALVYARQSKESDNPLSPDQQADDCKAVPEIAACAPNIEVFSDLDVSGGIPMEERPGGAKLLARLQALKGHRIIVIADEQGRFGRDSRDLSDFWRLIYPTKGEPIAELWTASGGRYPNNTDGWSRFTNQAVSDELTRRKFSDKMTKTMAYLNRNGMPTGQTPFGYMDVYVADDRDPKKQWRTWERDPETAPTVERVFAEFATGQWSTRQIADRLNAERDGAPVPGARRGSRGWTADRITDMLNNEAYRGRGRVIDPKTDQLVAAKWPRLVEDGLFERVRARMKAHAPTIRPGKKGEPTRDYTFKGLLWCAHCKRGFMAQRAYGNTGGALYRCGSNLRPEAERCTHGKHGIPEVELVAVIDGLLLDDFAEGVRMMEGQGRIAPKTAADAAAKIEAKMRRMREARAEGDYDDDMAEYRRKYRDLEGQLKTYRDAAAPDASLPEPEVLTSLADRWRTGDAKERHAVLSALFERIVVRDRDIIGFRPRADRIARADLLVNTARDYANAAPLSGSGKGGLVTVAQRVERARAYVLIP